MYQFYRYKANYNARTRKILSVKCEVKHKQLLVEYFFK